ncbi:LuxR C-terminal-related transcriptional regulator [Streptomyces sp. TRM 70351]|uniref:LuxR C-terminal-related transcriptional regulator n=1 Tax=Streptomyces sp. TRM 70351 TaxID=3116552 RepID=UPI002E7B428A|nr:LuxR C-terminal-related transcriptional regulator [Streptomyces sp. TRM 70351]MEE1930668.1 LuxR C-terminal-related transcriptional regulator [Streptomyces sp. TRM 70351]
MTTATTAPITPITPAQKRIAAHLVCGLTNSEIAGKEQLAHDTVKSHIRTMRQNLRCPQRSSRPVLAHTLLRHAQVSPPPLPAGCGAFEADEDDQRLIRAIAEHSRPADIARAAGMTQRHLRDRANDLAHRAGAADTTHLVALAHTHGILNSEGTAATQPPVTAPQEAAVSEGDFQ